MFRIKLNQKLIFYKLKNSALVNGIEQTQCNASEFHLEHFVPVVLVCVRQRLPSFKVKQNKRGGE